MSSRLLLALETSTHSGGAAILQLPELDGEAGCIGLVGSVCFTTKQLYSQRLLPSVEWLLGRTQVQVQDIAVIGIAIGPGSFTGLRIGLSVAKALAYASGAKIVGVGTLEALAVRASGGRDGLVCPMLDARQGQVYAGLYRVIWTDGLPRIDVVREDWAGPVQEVAGWISEPTYFAGDALELARANLKPLLRDKFLLPPAHQRLPHPEDVAMLAAARVAQGNFDDPISLEPHYVRHSYTQKNR